MIEFFKTLLAHLFGGTAVPTSHPHQPRNLQGGYHEGDDSSWIITDSGPMNTRR